VDDGFSQLLDDVSMITGCNVTLYCCLLHWMLYCTELPSFIHQSTNPPNPQHQQSNRNLTSGRGPPAPPQAGGEGEGGLHASLPNRSIKAERSHDAAISVGSSQVLSVHQDGSSSSGQADEKIQSGIHPLV